MVIFFQKGIDFYYVALREKKTTMFFIHRSLLKIETMFPVQADAIFAHFPPIDIVETIICQAFRIITSAISIIHTIRIVTTMSKYAMVLHTLHKSSIAPKTFLIMLPYARLEEHLTIDYDTKIKHFVQLKHPYHTNHAKKHDYLLLSPQKINLTACYLAKTLDYLLLNVKNSNLTANNRKKMRFFAISI